jgi:phosphohistidine phosphatase
MKLLVIRHGEAMDQEEFAEIGKSDDLRPLTSEGRSEMKKIAKGLRSEVKMLDVLATSSLVRAHQTADIVADVYGIESPEIAAPLVPGSSFDEFEKWCSKYSDKKVVAIVGHEPHLSSLVTWLLTGSSETRIKLKKGGACLLDFESGPERGSGTLNWLLTPRQLARS